MRLVVVVGASAVAWLASALPAQAQQVPLPADGNVAVCVEGVCAPGSLVPTGRAPNDLLEMTVGQTLPAQCAGQPETVYRVSEDLWVSTCAPERRDIGSCCGTSTTQETIQPIVRVSAAGETLTLVYSRKLSPQPWSCSTAYGSFVGVEHGEGSNPPKTGVWGTREEGGGGGPFCGP
jgi:hypothetical protein